MSVKLLHNTPLWIADKAIGKCWDKPTPDVEVKEPWNEYTAFARLAPGCNVERMERVANKNKHASTIEHLNYTFDITMSRACLQEWSRHRMTSLSVKSSRYTLKELKDEEPFADYVCDEDGDYEYEVVEGGSERAKKYLVFTDDDLVNEASVFNLEELRKLISLGIANDKAKYCLPECYKTSMVWTVNARSLQNFLALRTSKAALWEIRDIAYAVYYALPKSHRFLFADSVN